MKNAIIAAIISAAVSASSATAATKIIIGTKNIKNGAVTYEKLEPDLQEIFVPDDGTTYDDDEE